MGKAPKYAKAHSQLVADELYKLGWSLVCEFRVKPEEEPYEYLFEWKKEIPPAEIDWVAWREKLEGNQKQF